MKNDSLRHEIFGDVLSTHLGLAAEGDLKKQQNGDMQIFTKAFFLGRHEVCATLKLEIIYYKPIIFINTAQIRSVGAIEAENGCEQCIEN